ncbi:hypothetical protein TI05_11605 [Achromatium sp. WMS3]|nr:hypothetical protein TI05_11605 [Achromatium sp. WMS3]
MSLAFIPLYIKFLGIESFGLIGFFTTLQSIFALLDLGLGLYTQSRISSLFNPARTRTKHAGSSKNFGDNLAVAQRLVI